MFIYFIWFDWIDIIIALAGQPITHIHQPFSKGGGEGGLIAERWIWADLLLPPPLPSRKLSEMALYLLLNNCYCRRTFGEGSQKSTP